MVLVGFCRRLITMGMVLRHIQHGGTMMILMSSSGAHLLSMIPRPDVGSSSYM
jgi:hypothetical protein